MTFLYLIRLLYLFVDLVDDVGGLSGYCQMLESLHGSDAEEKESYKVWARSMGWTGRKIKPEKML